MILSVQSLLTEIIPLYVVLEQDFVQIFTFEYLRENEKGRLTEEPMLGGANISEESKNDEVLSITHEPIDKDV